MFDHVKFGVTDYAASKARLRAERPSPLRAERAMANYVDGFVIPIRKQKVKAYLRQAKLGARLWKAHGALAYTECVAEDLKVPFGLGFRKMARLEAGETVVFAWIVYRSRAHRDRVNAAVMKDPRMSDPAMKGPMPFDPRRIAVGGFKVLVSW
jgi:uncharacterized protein YbaA (DUF1428 family)